MNVKYKNELGIMDTPVKPEYDRKEVNCHSGPRAGIQGNDNLMPKAFRLNGFSGRTPDDVCRRMTGGRMSSSCLTRGSIKQQCRMDSRFRGNDRERVDTPEGSAYDRGEYGRFPLSVTLGRSETKTRGSIIAQSGRSMVEMLGTLAIIGVLSIGGVMGYRYGMDKYHANEIINDVNMRMIDVAQQVFRNQSEIAIPEDWDIKGRSGYVIDLFQNTDSEPSIMVEKVPTSVCKMVLQNTPDTQDIYVGVLNGSQVDGNWYLGNNDNICEGSDKEMLFAMSAEILAGFNPDSEDYVEPEGTATAPVVTKLECYSNADCDTEKPVCSAGTCVECTQNSHCPSAEPYCNPSTKLCTACYGQSTGTACKLSYATYEGMCYGDSNYACVDWCGETPLVGSCSYMTNYCKNQGGRATIYQLMLISDNPLYCKNRRDAGNTVTSTYGSRTYTYEGTCPDTERYKGLWSQLKNTCSDRRGRYISNVDGVEVNRTGSLTGSECGSGNWWSSGACYDDVQAIIDAYDAANPITE